MTTEARIAAATAVLRSAAMPADADDFWTLVAVGRSVSEFPAEVEAHRSDVAGLAFYPKGILALYALGSTVRVINAFDELADAVAS